MLGSAGVISSAYWAAFIGIDCQQRSVPSSVQGRGTENQRVGMAACNHLQDFVGDLVQTGVDVGHAVPYQGPLCDSHCPLHDTYLGRPEISPLREARRHSNTP